MAANPPKVKKARLYSFSDPDRSVDVHFNPTSLVYNVESSVPQGPDPKHRQYSAQFTGKLTMDLVFDTTDTGDDVRVYTGAVASFLGPANAQSGGTQGGGAGDDSNAATNAAATAPPTVCFEWGVYFFKGVMESFRETIDFFSEEGVPLRAVVSIGLARQDAVFDQDVQSRGAASNATLVPTGADTSVQDLVTLAGDPTAARSVAAANGLDSVRFTNGASVAVSGGVNLKAAAGFSASASADGGLGVALGGSASISAQGGSASLGASSSGALFGAKASAGVSATAGAFAGLESGRASATASLDPARVLRAVAGGSVATFGGASFGLGGAAKNGSGSGLSADVGVKFSFRERLTFDQDD
jgi:hypothetical protein